MYQVLAESTANCTEQVLQEVRFKTKKNKTISQFSLCDELIVKFLVLCRSQSIENYFLLPRYMFIFSTTFLVILQSHRYSHIPEKKNTL